MSKRYTKYGLFLLSRDYLVVWATMMGNECFMIVIYLFIYLFTHLFKVDNDKKDTVYKNTNKIAWG